MIIVRKSEDRRHIEGKNQQTWMTFDLENNTDPLQKGFGVLKILNEETLSPGTGFVLHTHKDMVVVTYVCEGVVVYKGPVELPNRLETDEFHVSRVLANAKQSVFNNSSSGGTRVFQSGFIPKAGILKKEGSKKLFTYAERKGILKLIASPNGKESSLPIEQDIHIYSTFINKGNHMIHELSPGRDAWLHVVKGHILLDDLHLYTGDGAGLSNELSVSFTAQEPTEILLFDLDRNTEEDTKPVPPNGKVAVKVL